MRGRLKVTVKFRAHPGNMAGAGIRDKNHQEINNKELTHRAIEKTLMAKNRSTKAPPNP